MSADEIPDWALQFTGDPEDYKPVEFYVILAAESVALMPDAFTYHLDRSLAALRKAAIESYYRQRGQ